MEPIAPWVELRSQSFKKVRYDITRGNLDVVYPNGHMYRYTDISLTQVYDFLKKSAVNDHELEFFKQSIEASSKKTKRIL
jgi:hypothetical protein